jgi:hypothetical protein
MPRSPNASRLERLVVCRASPDASGECGAFGRFLFLFSSGRGERLRMGMPVQERMRLFQSVLQHQRLVGQNRHRRSFGHELALVEHNHA